MGKTVLLLLVAAVVGSTYVASSDAEAEIETIDSHTMVQAKTFAGDMAESARSMVLGGVLDGGNIAGWPATVPSPFQQTETVWFGGGSSTTPAVDETAQWKVNRYEVDALSNTLSFVVTGRALHKVVNENGTMTRKWITHSTRSEYALVGGDDEIEGFQDEIVSDLTSDPADEPDPSIDAIIDASDASCGVSDAVLPSAYVASTNHNYGYGGSTPSIIRATDGLTVNASKMFKGQGLLIVDGDLVVNGHFKWKGIVLVHSDENQVVADFSNAQTVDIDGSVIVKHTADAPTEQGLLAQLLSDPSYGVMLNRGANYDVSFEEDHVTDALDCMGLMDAELVHLGTMPTSPEDEETGVDTPVTTSEDDDSSEAECESYNNGGGNGVDPAPGNSGNTNGDDADGSNTPGTIDTSGGNGSAGNSGNGNGRGNSGNGGRSNNGHGNNADGVDSSNPGQGHGGPNGEIDQSCTGDGPCVDDENGNGNGNGNRGNGNRGNGNGRGGN